MFCFDVVGVEDFVVGEYVEMWFDDDWGWYV